MASGLTLPQRWLKSSWVERCCTVQASDGSHTITTAAMDSPDLFLWIKDVHYPQLCAKQYRQALRDLCKDPRPGYQNSPLPDELRKLLNKRMKELGRKDWGHQQIIKPPPHAPPPPPPPAPAPPAPVPANLPLVPVAVSVVPCTANSTANNTAITDPSEHIYKVSSLSSAHQQQVGGSSSSSSSDNQHSQPDANTNAERSSEPTPKRLAMGSTLDQTKPENSGRLASYRTNNSTEGQIQGQVMAKPAEFSMIQLPPGEGSDEDDDDVDDENNSDDDTRVPLLDMPLQFQSQVTTGLVVLDDSRGFIEAFNEITESLHDFGLVSKSQYRELEEHFTSCFSGAIGFGVYYTNRHLTWRPSSYVNQTYVDCIGLDTSKEMHVVNDLSSIKRARDLISTGTAGDMIPMPCVWINCIDEFGKPIRKLVDMWLPVIKFNEDESVILLAPHNTVTMLRQPGPSPLC